MDDLRKEKQTIPEQKGGEIQEYKIDWDSYFSKMEMSKMQMAKVMHASFYIDSVLSGKASHLDVANAMLALSRVQSEEIPIPPCTSLLGDTPHIIQIRDIVITYVYDNLTKITDEEKKLIIKFIRLDKVKPEDIEFGKEVLQKLKAAESKKEPLVFFDSEILGKYIEMYKLRQDLVTN